MNDLLVKDGEVVEPLDDGYIVIQPKDGYRFGSDAVALANFAAKRIKNGARVFDLCSGCGVIGMSIAIARRDVTVSGAEIDSKLTDMSVRAAAANGLHVEFFNADIRKCDDKTYAHIFERNAFDAVVCNPPYYKADMPTSPTAPAANAELTVEFGDVAKAAARILKGGGALFLVHWAARLDEIMTALNAVKLVPKELTVNRNGKTFLLKAVKNARPGLAVDTGVF